MQKIKLFSSLLLAIGALLMFQSCQREVEDILTNQTQQPVSSKDPAKLSAALRVWHGTRTTGTPPAPNSNTPAIDPTANPSVLAVAGRYAIIKPEVTAGEPAGYYLGIPGAGQYFKIDYKKPRDIAGRNGLFPKRRGGFLGDTNADSSIVIVLPPSINVPDTFCVTYCPYDSLGNIGQPVTTCIYVTSIGTPATEGWLQNDFKLTSTWEDSSGVRIGIDTVIFNRWYSDDMGYACDNTSNPPMLYHLAGNPGATPIVRDSIYYTKNNFRLATNGAFDYTSIMQEKNLDWFRSTCSNFVFEPIYSYSDTTTGAYNYNPVTKKLILIFEFDWQGIPDPEYWEYDVIKLTDRHFILRDPLEGFAGRFER